MLLGAVRFFIAIIWFVVCCSVGVILAFLRPFHPSHMRWSGRLFGLPLFKVFGMSLKIRGENYLNERPCVFISNHQNNMDLIVMGAICPPRTVTLGKIEILYIPLFGLVYWLFGNILIVRGNKQKSKKSMVKVTETIRNKDISVWIMPEGTRSRGRGLLPFKSGAFRTAIDAQVPIVPICLNNYHHLIDPKKVKSGVVNCEVLPPIETKGLSMSDASDLAKRCHELMKNKIDQLDKESIQ